MRGHESKMSISSNLPSSRLCGVLSSFYLITSHTCHLRYGFPQDTDAVTCSRSWSWVLNYT
jgi:hypothetical protein